MIKVSKLNFKEKYLRNTYKNIKPPSFKNSILGLFLTLSLFSCSTQQNKQVTVKWEYPPDNPYPSIMKTFYYKEGPLVSHVHN